MKKLLRCFAIVLSLVFVFNISSFAIVVEKTVPLVNELKKDLPLNENLQPEFSEFNKDLSPINQTAFDAFFIEKPLNAFWVDFSASNIETHYSYYIENNIAITSLSSVKLKLQSYQEINNPLETYNEIMDVINGFTPDGETRYDIVKSIHDFVCGLCAYDNSSGHSILSYHVYGALISGSAVCQGYSEAFKVLCDKSGIPCVLISGNSINGDNEESHMWAYVLMDDGKWYAVDTTWDDGDEIEYNYFLVGSKTEIKGKKFDSTHIANGDISKTEYKEFLYPELSESEYVKTDMPFEPDSDFQNDWFSSQLDEEARNIYSYLISIPAPDSDVIEVDTPDETDSSDTSTDTDGTTTDTKDNDDIFVYDIFNKLITAFVIILVVALLVVIVIIIITASKKNDE